MPTGSSPAGPPPSAASANKEDVQGNKRPPLVLALTLMAMPLGAALGPWLGLNPGASGQIYFMRAVVLAAAPFALLSLLNGWGKVPASVIWWFLTALALLGWGYLSLDWTPDTSRGLLDLSSILIAMISVFVILSLTRGISTRIQYLRWGFFLALLATGAVGLWEIVTGNHLVAAASDDYIFAASTVSATFINPNNFASFLIMATPPVITLFATRPGLHSRILLLLSLALIALLLLRAGSRAGLFTFAVMVAFAILALSTVSASKFILGALAATAALFVTVTLFPQFVGAALNEVFTDTAQQSDSLRLELSQAGIYMFQQTSGFGHGAGSFITVLPEVPSDVYNWRLLPAHNTTVQIAAEYGVIALIPFLLLVLSLAIGALRQTSVVRRYEMSMVVLAFSVASFVTSSSLPDPSWWVVIAFAITLHWQSVATEDART
ncbi:O-antigen ligase family protein [Kytococcus sedentarius]|uniref:O-antigen ligase family protein n=1 Tax=Kytococcus sedentarius TaxID=1276 RepID=UPI0035BC4D42